MRKHELMLVAAALFILGGAFLDTPGSKNLGAAMMMVSVGSIAYALTSSYFDDNK